MSPARDGTIFLGMNQFAIVPAPKGDRFIELSRSRTGRLFRKQILHYGDLHYPGVKGDKVKVDDAFMDTMIANFSSGVCDIVQTPKVDGNNKHSEDPDRNIGEVVGLEKGPKGLYAIMDVRTNDAEKVGKTLLGSSAMLHLDYTDTATGKKVGPTLLHNAITNRPHVTNLDGFEEIIAASQSGDDIATQVLVLSPADNEENPMTLEEMLASLKADHNIDVTELQAKAKESEAAVALSSKIQEELVGTGLLTLSNGDETVSADALIGAVAEAGNKIVSLSNTVNELVEKSAKTEAESRVDKLVRTGFILPKKREAHVKLLLSSPETFEDIIPETPLVKLSNESGMEPVDETPDATIKDEIDRLSELAAKQ